MVLERTGWGMGEQETKGKVPEKKKVVLCVLVVAGKRDES